MDKVTAVRMYDYITDAWAVYLEEQQKIISKKNSKLGKLGTVIYY